MMTKVCHRTGAVLALTAFLLLAARAFAGTGGSRDVPALSGAPVDTAGLDTVIRTMVADLEAQARASGAKGTQTEFVRLEGVGWVTPAGDYAGTSAFGAFLNRRVGLALSKGNTVLSPGDAETSKGAVGTIVRGGFRLLRSGVSLSLLLLDGHSGNVLSTTTRLLGYEMFPGVSKAEMTPPAASDAQALAGLVTSVLGGVKSDFGLRVSTDRGGFGAYVVGESLTVFLESEKDCYVRLYHLSWDDRQLTLIFPNRSEQDGFLKAGHVRRVPGESQTYSLEVAEPYGVDVLAAVASLERFEDDDMLEARWSADSKSANAPRASADSAGADRAGTDCISESRVDEQRFRQVMAKGLIIREERGSQEADYGSDQTVDTTIPEATPSESANVLDASPASTNRGSARAACYFVTIKKPF